MFSDLEFLKSIICERCFYNLQAILFEEAGNISVLESALSEAEGSFSATDRHQEGVHESEKHRPPKTYTQPEAEKPKPKVRKCRHGAKCIHLKRGPGKCNFFHPPEEVAMYHPPSTSSRASQAKSTIPKRDKKRAKECSYGLNCKLLRKGPTICPFYHSPKEIYVFHPNAQISATDASVEASKTHFYSSVLHSSSQVESNNVIDANAAPRVVGKNKKHIRNMMKKSGTTISLTPKVDSNGRCMVHITGSTDQADKEAANMVVEASLRAFTFLESPEEISIMSVLTGDEVSLPTQPLSVTPTSSNKTGAEQLLSFFEQQKSFLKVPPKKFYNWLKSDDIDSFEAFVEACSDEDYQAEMQANGLKGFKRRPFFKAVKVAAGSG